jgi:putative transposase
MIIRHQGINFFTIVSHNRLPIFGEFIQVQIQLSYIGKIVEVCWLEIPNHFHSIVNIVEHQTVGMRHKVSSLRRQASPYSTHDQNTKPIGTPSHSLGAMIGSFKSAATQHIHQSC